VGEARDKAFALLKKKQIPWRVRAIWMIKPITNIVLILSMPLWAGFVLWFMVAKDFKDNPHKAKRVFTDNWFWE
jgi:hypothetical protein